MRANRRIGKPSSTGLRVQGFGDFYLKDKFLLLKTPFIHDCEIWKGILEGLLECRVGNAEFGASIGF